MGDIGQEGEEEEEEEVGSKFRSGGEVFEHI